jgi:hypothetical protein
MPPSSGVSRSPTRPQIKDPPYPDNNEERASCAKYAQRRRPDLGRAGGDGGADNYIDRDHLRHRVYQLDNDLDLRNTIAPGHAIVWSRYHPGLQGWPGEDYGHVAIVEEVHEDYVVISHSNWDPNPMRLNIDKLKNEHIYIIS